jgi:hypothetical protein
MTEYELTLDLSPDEKCEHKRTVAGISSQLALLKKTNPVFDDISLGYIYLALIEYCDFMQTRNCDNELSAPEREISLQIKVEAETIMKRIIDFLNSIGVDLLRDLGL